MMIYFDLDQQKQVYSRTAAKEQEIRKREWRLFAEHQHRVNELCEARVHLQTEIADLQEEADRLEELLVELRATEPLKTYQELKTEVASLRRTVKGARREASQASVNANQARQQANDAYRKANRDFIDLLLD